LVKETVPVLFLVFEAENANSKQARINLRKRRRAWKMYILLLSEHMLNPI
jgi:hypothetical protein